MYMYFHIAEELAKDCSMYTEQQLEKTNTSAENLFEYTRQGAHILIRVTVDGERIIAGVRKGLLGMIGTQLADYKVLDALFDTLHHTPASTLLESLRCFLRTETNRLSREIHWGMHLIFKLVLVLISVTWLATQQCMAQLL